MLNDNVLFTFYNFLILYNYTISFIFSILDGHGFEAKTSGITSEGSLLRHNGKIYPNPLGVPVLSIDYEGSKYSTVAYTFCSLFYSN